jgi:hypothetical protein
MLQGTQPLVSFLKSSPSPSETTGNGKSNSSFHFWQASGVSKAPR